MHRDQVLKEIAEHREELARDFGVKSLALFGSVVRGEAAAASDKGRIVNSWNSRLFLERCSEKKGRLLG